MAYSGFGLARPAFKVVKFSVTLSEASISTCKASISTCKASAVETAAEFSDADKLLCKLQ